MRYTVTWLPEVQNEVAEIWMRASDRVALARAVDRIDVRLAQSPEAAGEEFYGHRLLVDPPVGVTFTISPEDRIVKVLGIWYRPGT